MIFFDSETLIDAIKWSNSYHAEGKISLPITNTSENFEAWYDASMGCSRIDYQNGNYITNYTFKINCNITNIQIAFIGETQTYQLSHVGPFGITFKVLYNYTVEREGTETCSSVRGSKEFRITPQVILPDMTNYTVS